MMSQKKLLLIAAAAGAIFIFIILAFTLMQNGDGAPDNTPGIKEIEVVHDESIADGRLDFTVRVVGLPDSHTVVLQYEIYDGETLFCTGWNQMDEKIAGFTATLWMMDTYPGLRLKYRVAAFEGVVSHTDEATPLYETEWHTFNIP